MICVTIDELSPCLTDIETGETVKTKVVRIREKSIIAGLNSKNHWYVNWQELADKNEIYALTVKDTMEIQGLIALRPLPESKSVYISWVVAAPQNNPEFTKAKKYNGVGGHLLAIAIDRSEQLGYGGDVTGFCKNTAIMDRLIQRYGAVHIGAMHPYQIGIYDDAARHIREVYDYEWTRDDL